MNMMLKAALKYAELGYSIIPVGKDKKPKIKWEQYQKQKADKEQIHKWWEQYPDAGIAIITGAISGISVVDIDTPEGGVMFISKVGDVKCPTSLTPGGGKHLYFRDIGQGNKVNICPGVDFRGEGGYIIAPPSPGPNGGGTKYRWIDGMRITDIPTPEPPIALFDLLNASFLRFQQERNEERKKESTKERKKEDKKEQSTLYTKYLDLGESSYTGGFPRTPQDSMKNEGDQQVADTRDNVEDSVGCYNALQKDYNAFQSVTKRYIDFNEGSRDESLFHVANLLVKGGALNSEVEQILMHLGRNACNPPFPEKEILLKVQSAIERAKRKDRNIAQEIRDILSVTSGNISVTFLSKELQCVTKQERTSLRVGIHRLVQAGILEPTGKRAGEYHIVNVKYDIVNLMEIEQGNVLDIKLPFEMQDIADIYAKDLIVYAGAPNAGKTAMMLETVRLNMDKWKCWYFSTEMGRFNARDRLAKHDTCKDWKFQFIDEVPNYVDVLHPDDMNFIDYVETDAEGNYYKIAGILGSIQKKMRKGVVFVALQKKTGMKYALGGEQTKAKASLFCTVDADYPGAVVRLEKVKNFKGSNPNGFMRRFKIRGGINVEAQGAWGPEF